MDVKAVLDWSLRVECPACKTELDLVESPHDDEGEFSRPIFNNNWDKCKGARVCCTGCEHVFQLSEIIY